MIGVFAFRAYQKYKEQQAEEQLEDVDKPANYGEYTGPKDPGPQREPEYDRPQPKAKPQKRTSTFEELFGEIIEEAQQREREAKQQYQQPKPKPQAQSKPMLDMMGRPIESIESGPSLDSLDVNAPKEYTFSDALTGATLEHDPTKPVMGGIKRSNKKRAKAKKHFNPRKAYLYKELLERKYFNI